MGRSPCCSKEGVNRGAWTPEEDRILTQYISANGIRDWRNLPKNAGLNRCGKSCRLRWLNYLRPDIKRGNISEEEEELVIRLHKLLGNRWSLIAGRLPGRTDNEIKNYWNTRLRKRYEKNTETDSPQTCKNRKPKIKKEPEFVKIVPVKTIAIRPKVKREEQESAGLEKKVDVPMSLSWEELFMMSQNDDNGNVVAPICNEEDAFDDLFEFAYPSNSVSSSSSLSPLLMEGNGEDNLKEWGTMDDLQPLSPPFVSSP